jgi:hypothetical protein
MAGTRAAWHLDAAFSPVLAGAPGLGRRPAGARGSAGQATRVAAPRAAPRLQAFAHPREVADTVKAIGAYHRGARRAGDDRGVAYLETVLRRRARYIRGGGSSPSWSRILELAGQAPLPPLPSRPLPGSAPPRVPLLD